MKRNRRDSFLTHLNVILRAFRSCDLTKIALHISQLLEIVTSWFQCLEGGCEANHFNFMFSKSFKFVVT